MSRFFPQNMIRILYFGIIMLMLNSCTRYINCIGGGEVVTRQKYLFNYCGLGDARIEEIEVDSFSNNLPAKYRMTKWARLYDYKAPFNKEPKKLYYIHCDTLVAAGTENVDKMQCPFIFNTNKWYVVKASSTLIFIYVDNNGKKYGLDPFKKTRNLGK
jgi:hypothetical protein